MLRIERPDSSYSGDANPNPENANDPSWNKQDRATRTWLQQMIVISCKTYEEVCGDEYWTSNDHHWAFLRKIQQMADYGCDANAEYKEQKSCPIEDYHDRIHHLR